MKNMTILTEALLGGATVKVARTCVLSGGEGKDAQLWAGEAVGGRNAGGLADSRAVPLNKLRAVLDYRVTDAGNDITHLHVTSRAFTSWSDLHSLQSRSVPDPVLCSKQPLQLPNVTTEVNILSLHLNHSYLG